MNLQSRLLIIALLALTARAAAQEDPGAQQPRRGPVQRATRSAGFAFGSGEQTTLFAASIGWDHSLTRLPRAQVGYGVRLNLVSGSTQNFTEADPNIPPAQRASILIEDPLLVAVNFFAQAQFALLAGVAAGFNIDAIGIGFGPSRVGVPSTGATADSTVSAQHFNLLQGGIRDRGSLNSEFYVAFRVRARVAIRVGFAHAVSGYEVSRAGGGRKYQRFVTFPFVAIRLGR